MAIQIKRIYEEPEKSDGRRILVDRLWPRGLSEEQAQVDLWVKEIAPSTELRQWYNHDPLKWPEFKKRYAAELVQNRGQLDDFLKEIEEGSITLLYSSKERHLNNAVALREYLTAL